MNFCCKRSGKLNALLACGNALFYDYFGDRIEQGKGNVMAIGVVDKYEERLESLLDREWKIAHRRRGWQIHPFRW